MTHKIHFDKPPLDEVVCGLHFEGIGWQDIHYGLFYQALAGRYPQINRVAPLSTPGVEGISILEQPDLPRLWFSNGDQSPYLIQVQPDRFYVNWRKLGKFRYPHFMPPGEDESVVEVFQREWDTFCRFCETTKIGIPALRHYELTYINHLVVGEDVQDASDVGKLLGPLGGLTSLPDIASINFTVAYRASVPIKYTVKSAQRIRDRARVFVLEISTFAPVSAGGKVQEDFERANEQLTSEFKRLSSQIAHARWGLV